MNLGSLYESMFNTVVSGGIQKILKSAYEIIRLPMVVVDTSYNVLAVNNSENVKDDIWNYLIKEKQASSELVWIFHKDKYIESVCNSFKPVYLNWGRLEIPQISGAIRVNGIVRGYIGVVCPESEFKEELIEAISIVANALALDMKNHKSENTQNNPLLEIFTRDLLSNNFKNNEQIESWRDNFPYIFKKDYMIVSILPPSNGEYGLLQYFSSTITSKYSNILSTILGNTLFLFFYNLHNKTAVENIKRDVSKIVDSFQTYCSISKVFSNILDASNYKFQVEKSLELGMLLKPKERIYYYDDYSSATIFSYALNEMEAINYIHPIIKKLEEFDEKNNTDYLNTLESYIGYICDSKKVSYKLHIHRNTLLYRLNKISELTDCNLADENICIQLMMSFQMINLKKQIDKSVKISKRKS